MSVETSEMRVTFDRYENKEYCHVLYDQVFYNLKRKRNKETLEWGPWLLFLPSDFDSDDEIDLDESYETESDHLDESTSEESDSENEDLFFDDSDVDIDVEEFFNPAPRNTNIEE